VDACKAGSYGSKLRALRCQPRSNNDVWHVYNPRHLTPLRLWEPGSLTLTCKIELDKQGYASVRAYCYVTHLVFKHDCPDRRQCADSLTLRSSGNPLQVAKEVMLRSWRFVNLARPSGHSLSLPPRTQKLWSFCKQLVDSGMC
jgi:hypothetical protein